MTSGAGSAGVESVRTEGASDERVGTGTAATRPQTNGSEQSTTTPWFGQTYLQWRLYIDASQ